MPLQATSGAASYDAFGGGVPVVPTYIEDVFSTFLYQGNGSTQTINNGIDLAGKGGLTWFKERSGSTWGHALFSGIGGYLRSQSTDAVTSNSSVSNTSSGFTLNDGGARWNANGTTYASWTFREQPKFFDCVTYTGNGSDPQTISHNLGSVPGCMIVKRTDSATNGSWYVYHRSLTTPSATATNNYLLLNTTDASVQDNGYWGFGSSITATTFQVNNQSNTNGATYVAYLFAHNAGGFGLSGTDNVISCGSFTSNGSGVASVNLGYEPQWILAKQTNGTTAWFVIDNMRGFPVKGTASRFLSPNNSTAENGTLDFSITNTGFDYDGASDAPFIYIAIRRGPMRTPTTGTSVYTSSSRTGTAGVIPRWTAGFPVDWALRKSDVTTGGGDWQAGDRLRGAVQVKPNLTEAETAASPLYTFDSMTGYSSLGATGSDTSDRSWMFRRAPSFFDEVCYTGTGSATTQTHNLGVAPELVIWKRRNSTADWRVWQSSFSVNDGLYLNLSFAKDTDPNVQTAIPTATVLNLATGAYTNSSGSTYVAYLFASCPGVSKVFNYTGNGSSQTINCGFTGGARFVMIKRTDSTGDWYVWDSARGIVSGNDPRLSLNTTAAEVTTDDSVDTDSTGFVVNQLSATNINVSSATYIGIAIA